MDVKPLVSICCLVYNHEKYLKQCLDGFVNQKTTFKFEILIHDDASTDHSKEIIQEYVENYPDLFYPIYQTKNQMSQGVRVNYEIQYKRAKGKYIALCEGDDYWCDPFKLQRQVDVLENFPHDFFCAHKVEKISPSGVGLSSYVEPNMEKLSIIDGTVFLRRYFSGSEGYPFQTSSYLFRRELIETMPDFKTVFRVGDVPIFLWGAYCGNIHYIDEPMSCYRVNAPGSTNLKLRNQEYALKRLKGTVEGFISFNYATNEAFYHDMFHQLCYLSFQIWLTDKEYTLFIPIERIKNELSIKEKTKCWLKSSRIGYYISFIKHKKAMR